MSTASLIPLAVAEGFSVKGQVVVVTGGAGIIGSRIVEAFALNGAKVVCSDRPGEGLTKLVEEFTGKGFEVMARAADLTKPEDLRAMVEEVKAKWGRIDTLVNCGGIATSGALEEEDDEAFDRMYHTNVRSMWVMVRAVKDTMTAQGGGSIINIASINAYRAFFPCSLYAGTKAAVLNMTRELSGELSEHFIRVNSISPGSINNGSSPLVHTAKRLHEPYAGELLKRFEDFPYRNQQGLGKLPLHMSGRPEDVAMACLYLASPAARYVTGADLVIDGGRMVDLPTNDHARSRVVDPFWKSVYEYLVALPETAWCMEKPKWLRREQGRK